MGVSSFGAPPQGGGGGAVTSADITDDTIVNADIKSNAAIDYSKLAALTDGNILVGNVSNVAVSVTPSGDVTFSNSGVTAIGADKITEAMMANDAIGLAELKAGTDGELITWDVNGDPAAVAVGTSGQVLTSNGAGAAPTFQAAAGGGDGTLEFSTVYNNWGSSRPAGWIEETASGASVTYDTSLALVSGTTANGRVQVGFFMRLAYGRYRFVMSNSAADGNCTSKIGIGEFEGGTNTYAVQPQNVACWRFAGDPAEHGLTTLNGTSTQSADTGTDQTVSGDWDIIWEVDQCEFLFDNVSKATNSTNLPDPNVPISFFAAQGNHSSGPSSSRTVTITEISVQ
tara:strand:+ start:1953 stop:2978 length:1026 start_codon:yes stop_codon:yes gene_type:complete